MRKVPFPGLLALFLLLSAALSFGAVSISAPANSATVTSPVRVTANGTSTSKVTAIQIYVDSRLQTTVQGATINVALPMNAGQRRIMVKVWDNTGANTMAQLYVTVLATTGGRQYFVSPTGNDSDSGSASTPWRTLSHADRSARPGDTIHVASGTYPGSSESGGRLKTLASGTASARVRWIAESKWGAQLTSSITGNKAVW